VQSFAHKKRGLGLSCAADTRMAGHFIAFQPMLRLKDAISSTITSSEFITLKVAKEETKLLKDDMIWQCIEDLVRAAFPALRVLRLADKQIAGMDKLYYYVRKTDLTLTTKANNLNQIASKEVELKLKSFFSSCDGGLNENGSDDDDFSDSSSSTCSGDDSTSSDNDTQKDEESDDDADSCTLTPKEGYKFEYLTDKKIHLTNIVAQFQQAWGKRRKKLVHYYSITG
jgi:hypothetical protein